MYDVDIVMIGHFAKDRLVVDGVGEVASGGAVYYGGIALSHIGAQVAVVTRLHPGDRERLSELTQAGIQVYASDAPETSGIENIYSSADMERRICRPLGFAGRFDQQEIPDLKCRVYLASPIMAGEIDLSLLRWLAGRAPVGLDVQGFVRVREGTELVFRQWPDMAEGLRYVTYLKADRAEAEMLTGQTDLRAAARELASYGPHEVVLTQSSGVTVYAGGRFYGAPFTSRSLSGRTGRGDTCFSTYVGKRLAASADEACRFAAAVTSLKQEHPGPWRGPLSDVESRLVD